MQEFLVAVGLRGATLQHRVLPSGLSWHEQVRLLRFSRLHLQFQAHCFNICFKYQAKPRWRIFVLGCVLLSYFALESVILCLLSCLSLRPLTDCSLALKFLLVYSFATVPLIILNLCPQHVREVLGFLGVFCCLVCFLLFCF